MSVRLPPLQWFRYFEAAARHRSFKAAAGELNVTPGAVSQHVKSLEDFLGRKLFERRSREVVLTESGVRLGLAATRAIMELSEAVCDIDDSRVKTSIKVQVGPFFSARWLTPQLNRFGEANPDVLVELRHSLTSETPGHEIDLSIRWGTGGWHAPIVRELMSLDMQPISAPSLIGSAAQANADWFAKYPLLHVRDRDDWRDWLAAAGLPTGLANNGPVFDEPNVTVEAAAAGLGIAIGYHPLIDADLSSGRLIAAHSKKAPSRKKYYCVVASTKAYEDTAVRRFFDWLVAECDKRSRNSAQ